MCAAWLFLFVPVSAVTALNKGVVYVAQIFVSMDDRAENFNRARMIVRSYKRRLLSTLTF